MSSYAAQQQRTISQSDCDMLWKVDFTRQPATTSTVVGPRSSKALCKAKGCAKKSHGYCLVVCCPSDPLQLFESGRNCYIWEVCSVNQWNAPKTAMPTASIGQQKGPDFPPGQCLTAHRTADTSNSWTNWAKKFCLICYIHLTSYQLTTTSSSILTNFCRENVSTTNRRQNMLSRPHQIPKHRLLCYRKNNLLLIDKNMLILMVLILMNEDVFEPRYKDLISWSETTIMHAPT